jgi:serine/threonine-protein kinase HipA
VVHCLEVAADFLLSTTEAKTIIDQQIATLSEQWQTIAEEAGMNESEMNALWRRQLLNPFALYDYKPT